MSKFVLWLKTHRLACFGLMALSFLVFALLTYDFVRVLHANAGYLSSYGLMGLLDGGLVQLLGLLLTGLGAMGAWLVYKICETLLVGAFVSK
ncbi:hypothetical protein [Roseateles sp.]|uniref:hypothetical protein n=1 Tax=Roseateles sp. TaxID=1971397 RepID=UPI0039518BF9